MAAPRDLTSPQLRRALKASGLLLAGAVALVVALHAASRWWADDVAREAEALGIDMGTANPAPRAPVTATRARLIARLAGLAPEAADPPATPATLTPPAPASSPHEGLDSLVADDGDRVSRRWLRLLGLAVRDEDAEPSAELVAWLRAHAGALDAAECLLLAEPDATRIVDVVRQLQPLEADARYQFSRKARRLSQVLGARAAWAAADGRQADAERTCSALQRLTAIDLAQAASWAPRVPGGTLRRVRPSDPSGWIELIDASIGRDQLLDEATRQCTYPAPTKSMRIGVPELDVLLDDLPRPVETVIQRGLIVPAGRVQWAMRTRRILAKRERVEGGGPCLPNEPNASEWSWEAALRFALAQKANLLLTREVLRRAQPQAGIEPASMPCPDWTVIAEPMADGSLRIAVSDPAREMLAHPRMSPLERVIPPGP